MKTLIKNGAIVTVDGEYKGNILIDGEKIAAVGIGLDAAADKVIDAAGKYVMPGGVDQHTHFEALCNSGDRDTAGYETTRAVLVGGTTTIVDFAPQDPGRGLIESIDYRINKRAKGKICVDFALHGLVTEANEKMFDEIAELPGRGVPSLKLFMAYKGSPLHIDDGALYKAMLKAREVGVSIFVHAENADWIDCLQRDCVSKGHTAPKYHAVSRPPGVEVEAVLRALFLANKTNSPLYIVHMSAKESVEAMREANASGQIAQGEVTTHHLCCEVSKLDNPDFNIAARYVCSPALREQAQIDALWDKVARGDISAIVSDHCGIDIGELKQTGRDNFVNIPNGSPGAADRFNMIWTKGVVAGRISKQRFVETMCTNPARLNGIYPRKGAIAVGSDADIVLFDPDYRGRVRLADNPNGVDYNIYEGEELHGRVDTVLLRGRVAVEGGKFIGEPGQGEFIPGQTFNASFVGL